MMERGGGEGEEAERIAVPRVNTEGTRRGH